MLIPTQQRDPQWAGTITRMSGHATQPCGTFGTKAQERIFTSDAARARVCAALFCLLGAVSNA
eukprot:690926-Prymnesium_polylepis.1